MFDVSEQTEDRSKECASFSSDRPAESRIDCWTLPSIKQKLLAHLKAVLSDKSHRTAKKKCSEETPRAKCAKASSAKRLRWLGEEGRRGGGGSYFLM